MIDPLPLMSSPQFSTLQPFAGYSFAPGLFHSLEKGDEYLNSLDSDTRDYVMKNTSEYRTVGDIKACVDKLHAKS